MKKLLPLLLLLWSGLALPAITYVRDTSSAGAPCANASATVACSFGTLPAAGNNIVVTVFGAGNNSACTASDNQGGSSYTTAYGKAEANYGSYSGVLYRENISSPSGTFTVTVVCGGAAQVTAVAAEVSGLATSSSFDKSNTTGDVVSNWCNGGTTTTTSTGTLSVANEIVFTVAGGRNNGTGAHTVATPSGYILAASQAGAAFGTPPVGFAYKIVSATTAVTAAWVCNDTGNAFTNYGTASLATFEQATAASSLNMSVIRIGGGSD